MLLYNYQSFPNFPVVFTNSMQYYKMHRNKQKQEEKKSPQVEGQLVQKKISELRLQINQSRNKLDAYLGVISNQVGQIVSHRLNKFVALHSEIVQEKDHEIKVLEEQNQQVQLSQAGSNLQKLMKSIANYEAELQRVNTIKEMFRKQSERFKIQLEIKDKELDACKKREKQLMRQIWVLQQDIKDIYQGESKYNQSSNPNNYNTPIKKIKSKTQSHERDTRPSNVIVATEPTQMQEKEKFQMKLQDKYSGYKAGLHMGATKLRQKFSISSMQKRVNSSFKSNAPSMHASNVKKSTARPISMSQTKEGIDIYEDLRSSLRRASRMKETHSQIWDNQDEKALKVQDFRTICLYGPKIMQQIEGVVIQRYGQLRQIDESSIELLNCLFKSENAIKILEIVLFSYSLQAISHINQHKQQYTKEIAYNQPEIYQNEPIMTSTVKPKRIKMQKQLRKKFKNAYIQRTNQLFSHRASEK